MAGIQLTAIKHRDPESTHPHLAAHGARVTPTPNHVYENRAFSDAAMGATGHDEQPRSYPGDTGVQPSNGFVENDFREAIDPVRSNSYVTQLPPVEEKQEEPNCCLKRIQQTQSAISGAYQRRQNEVKLAVLGILAALYAVYFAFAMRHKFGDEGSVRLLWVTCVAVAIMVYIVFKRNCGQQFYSRVLKPPLGVIEDKFIIFKWLFIAAALIGLVVFLGVEIIPKSPYNLVSLGGIVVFILLLYIFSNNPSKVRWRPVFWGLGIQFVFALIIIRTQPGYDAFSWLGDRIREFLEHTNAGASFVFGEKYTDHMFAFKVLPTIIFFSTMISILYYLGVMQLVVQKLGWLMQVTLGTTPGESLNAAGNIFLGQTEAPLLVRPLLPDMTTSELFAVMTGGYASIAGTVMATFILFGVPPNHLITASVMAAPAALAIAKLFYPETEESRLKKLHLERPPHRNAIEAASAGASGAIKLVANIAANLLAFISLLAFVNATLRWFGERVGLEQPPLTFQLICSYAFWPISFLMGVLTEDCRKVAELIGMKIFINEFVAYKELGGIVGNTKSLSDYTLSYPEAPADCVNRNLNEIYLPGLNSTLVGGVLKERSQTIATYALCGFANISSLGVAVGALGAMAPSKKATLSNIALRALIAGNCANFVSACVAGLLYQSQNKYPANFTYPC